jgi:V/A-type H+-transporting ATPase subunit F
MEIAFVGGSESVLGFNLAGVKKSYAANTEEEMVSKIGEVMADSNVGILVLKQSDYNKLPKRLQEQLSDLPCRTSSREAVRSPAPFLLQRLPARR